jgi:hypothetical protein
MRFIELDVKTWKQFLGQHPNQASFKAAQASAGM